MNTLQDYIDYYGETWGRIYWNEAHPVWPELKAEDYDTTEY